MADISDLLAPVTSDQIRATMVATLVTLGVPADQWRPGGVASTILTVVAMVYSTLLGVLITIIQGFFLPTASGIGLVLLAKYMYGVTVPSATFATGNVFLQNQGGAVYTFATGQYSAVNPQTGVTYTNTAPFTLGSLGSVTVSVVASVAGTAGNSTPGTITQNVTSLTGVVVTNPAALIGIDAPTDAAIRLLCTNKLGILSVRGVRTAYAYAVQTAVNSVTGAPVNINRWAITASSHTGFVNVYVAAPSGTPDPNDVTGVQNNIEAIARPDAVTATAIAATGVPMIQSVFVTTSQPAGTTVSAIQTAISIAIAAYISQFRIGGVIASDDTMSNVQALFADGIRGAIGQGAASIGATVISTKGLSDLILADGQVATNQITVTVTTVPATSGFLS